ncbi:MAG TPA: translation elongation factor 4, partial [Turneriella sp.]|nr:translation elongation factor 4 [Turneriella sp.]
YILPVINKIDLPSADVEKTKKQIAESLGLNPDDAVAVSGKSGINVEALMQAIIDKIPAPELKVQDALGHAAPRMASGDLPARALVFDAYFDAYRGVVEKIRVFDGEIKKGDQIYFMRKGVTHPVNEIGISQLKLVPTPSLKAGEVGYIVTGIKNVADVMLGDTITLAAKRATEPLFKYKEVKPMVFSGLFPVNGDDYPLLKESMDKLALNDPALIYEPESSEALGFGFRVGYLGLLHMEIVQERLEREFDLALLTTAPSVTYHIYFQHKPMMTLNNPAEFPDPGEIDRIEEPYVKVSIISPSEYMGAILQLLADKRGENVSLNYLDPTTVQIIYLVPLAEMIFEFYDRLKSVSRGYASLDYEFSEYRKSALVKLDILVHANRVDALSMIVHKNAAELRGRQVIEQLKEHIAKHQFQIA